MNITNFITWFIEQFISIGTSILTTLDNIKIYNTVSLLDFTITIAIIGIFIEIVITIPNQALRNADRINAKKARESRQKNEK